MTIPPGLAAVPTQDYWTARPQVFGLVHGPGETADQARQDYLNAYTYANRTLLQLLLSEQLLLTRLRSVPYPYI